MITDTRTGQVVQVKPNPISGVTREELFAKDYFNGGQRYGGYSREGYWDYPCHEMTAQHVLERKPDSVLELGCARGYILKRIQDAGIPGSGLEISRHAWLTRVCEGIVRYDLCVTPWPFKDKEFDLLYSVAVMEHVEEQYLPAVICEMERVSKRCLHGIDFGEHDDGFDKTHQTLQSESWWKAQFAKHAPNYHYEVVNKELLEQGEFLKSVLEGDGRLKLNIGSHSVMSHHGWLNMDVLDLNQFAQQNGYKFKQHDVRNGMLFNTGSVDMIFSSHMLEHLNYADGLKFLRECRRVLNPATGVMRILVPDAGLLMGMYDGFNRDEKPHGLREFDEINDNCAASPTAAGKLWSLLGEGHLSCYDAETLCKVLEDAGFLTEQVVFRQNPKGLNRDQTFKQLDRECLQMFPCLSLHVCAVPRVG